MKCIIFVLLAVATLFGAAAFVVPASGQGGGEDGRPNGEAVHKTCFACHAPGKDRDFVFTHYAH